MILEFFTIIFGSSLGVLFGLIPGMHINLIAILLLNLNFESRTVSLLILSIGVAQNFSESIQTTFFGTPTPQTALLPAQKMLKEGKGYLIIQKFVIGALFGTIIAILISPALQWIIPIIYYTLKQFTYLILCAIILILILKEKTMRKKALAFLIAAFAGIFGLLVLNSHTNQPLFLMLSSLFGTSALLNSLINKTNIPEQKIQAQEKSFESKTIIASIGGVVCLVMTTILPGIGGAQAAMLPSKILKIKNEHYASLIGSIGTADFIISLITLSAIHKSRNGAIAIISTIIMPTQTNIIFLFSTALITSGIAAILTLIAAKKIIKILNKINYSNLSFAILLFLIIIGAIFAGINGVLILITGTTIGLLTLTKELHRSHLMACLIIPIITNLH